LSRASRLKDLIAQPEILLVPGAFDAVSARLVERVGFGACYMTGAGTVTALAALPDIGLLSVTEMATNARYIANAVTIPVFADADTGYGNAINVMRTVREYEQAGLAGLRHVAPSALQRLEPGTEFGGEHDLVAPLFEPASNDLLAPERSAPIASPTF